MVDDLLSPGMFGPGVCEWHSQCSRPGLAVILGLVVKESSGSWLAVPDIKQNVFFQKGTGRRLCMKIFEL